MVLCRGNSIKKRVNIKLAFVFLCYCSLLRRIQLTVIMKMLWFLGRITSSRDCTIVRLLFSVSLINSLMVMIKQMAVAYFDTHVVK